MDPFRIPGIITVRVWGSPYRHILQDGHPQEDLGYTVCGIRFAWTQLWPGKKQILTNCPDCQIKVSPLKI